MMKRLLSSVLSMVFLMQLLAMGVSASAKTSSEYEFECGNERMVVTYTIEGENIKETIDLYWDCTQVYI